MRIDGLGVISNFFLGVLVGFVIVPLFLAPPNISRFFRGGA